MNKSFLMSKEFFNFLITFLSPLIILGQSAVVGSGCNKIKEGTFYFYPANAQKAFAVVREGAIQKEINLNTNDTSFWKVNWENDCVFSVKFIRKSHPMSDDEKSFYNSHITVFKILTITKEYYVFKAGLDSISNANILTDTMWRKAR
jgi:hypothetical protein